MFIWNVIFVSILPKKTKLNILVVHGDRDNLHITTYRLMYQYEIT